MKVIHLLDSLNRGGAETLELDILKNAAENNLNLTLAATGGGALAADFRRAGAEFIEPRKFPIDPFVVRRLRGIIERTSADVIHAHQAVEGIHAYLAARGSKVKIVLSHHGFVADWKNRQMLRFLIPRVTHNVVVSEALKNWYLQTAKLSINQNLSIVYNGVDANRLRAEKNSLRRELRIADSALLFGMVSNFYRAPRKDQLTLCRALPKVFAQFPGAHCVFAGRTETGAEAKFAECVELCRKNNISERVHFLGLRQDIPQILHSLDVFVLSSLHEGLPISVLEAMLAGVSCVLSDIAPLLEISQNGEFAEIFPVQNFEILAQKLIKLAENDSFRLKLAERSKIYAKRNFSIEAHIAKLKNVYESII